MLRKTLCMIVGIMCTASLFSLSARLVALDFEYDCQSDSSYIIGTYNFVWETNSGSMTGFYYLFDRDVEIDNENSFAIVNNAQRTALDIRKVGSRYDICLEGKNRFSGRCDYTVLARFPKIANATYTFSSGIFDTTMENAIITVIYGLEADQARIADIETNGSYDDIVINKSGIGKKALRAEKDWLGYGQELHLSFSIEDAEESQDPAGSLLAMMPNAQYDSRLISATEYERISKLISHFDLVLENLPDSVILEFANSTMFDTYKSVCGDFGLLGKDQSSLTLLADGSYLVTGDKVGDLYLVLHLFQAYIDELPDENKEQVKQSEEYVFLLQMLGTI